MIYLLNKKEYSAFLQLLDLKTQLSEINQIKYPASAQLTQKSTAFAQLFEKMYSFSAGLKRNAAFLQLFKKYAEKLQKSRLLRSFYTELRLIFDLYCIPIEALKQ